MLVPHLLKIYFGLGWPSSVLEIVSSQRLKQTVCLSRVFEVESLNITPKRLFQAVSSQSGSWLWTLIFYYNMSFDCSWKVIKLGDPAIIKYQSVTHVSPSIFQWLSKNIVFRSVPLVTKKLWVIWDFFTLTKLLTALYPTLCINKKKFFTKNPKIHGFNVKNENARVKVFLFIMISS